jgi:uncharacterized protein (TIGR03545 family)
MSTKTPKPKKAIGPIRFEAIVPSAIVISLIAGYFVIFFDSHLKTSIEWALAQGNGAEANIASLKTSFRKGTFELKGLALTDPKKPTHNRLAIGEVAFGFSWDAALRAKLLIELARVSTIETGSERKKPGRVLPPAPPGEGSKLWEKAKQQLMESSMGGFADILKGVDPAQLLGSLEKLRSVVRVDELRAQVDQKEKEWKSLIATLPSEKDLAEIQSKISAISAAGSAAEIAVKLGQARLLVGEVDGKIKAVTQVSSEVSADAKKFSASLTEIDDLMKKDRQEIEKKLKLPSLDPKELARDLFSPMITGRMAQAQAIQTQVRRYLPKNQAQTEEPRRMRANGKTYDFPVQGGYPLFWIKRAEISSTGKNAALGGDVKGEILNLTSNQKLTGQVTLVKIDADFKSQKLRGISAVVTLDQLGQTPKEKVDLKVASYPIEALTLSDSPGLRLALAPESGTASLRGTLEGDRFALEIENKFVRPNGSVESNSPVLKDLLEAIFRELAWVDVTAGVRGTFSDFTIEASSNLGRAIASGLQKQLQSKLAEARSKIEAHIQNQISGKRKELDGRLNSVKSQALSQVEERKKQIDVLKKTAEQKVAQVASPASGGAGKVLESLKKKLPF